MCEKVRVSSPLSVCDIIALAVVILPLALIIRWKAAPPSGMYCTGFLQSDQNTYNAFFRSVFERGNGFTYSSPYTSPGKDNPPVFFQLPYTLLAWIWKLTGEHVLVVWKLYRAIIGAGLCVMLYLFILSLFKRLYPEHMNRSFSRRCRHLAITTLDLARETLRLSSTRKIYFVNIFPVRSISISLFKNLDFCEFRVRTQKYI